jgi:hypothetical protein
MKDGVSQEVKLLGVRIGDAEVWTLMRKAEALEISANRARQLRDLGSDASNVVHYRT